MGVEVEEEAITLTTLKSTAIGSDAMIKKSILQRDKINT